MPGSRLDADSTSPSCASFFSSSSPSASSLRSSTMFFSPLLRCTSKMAFSNLACSASRSASTLASRCICTSCSHSTFRSDFSASASLCLVFCSEILFFSKFPSCRRKSSTSRSAMDKGSDKRLFSRLISNMSRSFVASLRFISLTSSFKVLIRSRLLCVMSL